MFTIQDLVKLLDETIATIGLPAPEPWLMASIAMTESGGQPFAHHHNANGSIDRGLWQINSLHQGEYPDIENIAKGFIQACYTPEYNAALAVKIWQKQGYHAWSSFIAILRD